MQINHVLQHNTLNFMPCKLPKTVPKDEQRKLFQREPREKEIQGVQKPDRFISDIEVYLFASYPVLIVHFLYLILFSLEIIPRVLAVSEQSQNKHTDQQYSSQKLQDRSMSTLHSFILNTNNSNLHHYRSAVISN